MHILARLALTDFCNFIELQEKFPFLAGIAQSVTTHELSLKVATLISLHIALAKS